MVNNITGCFAKFDPTETGPKFTLDPNGNFNNIKRVANLALPIIHMYKPVSTVIKLSFIAYDLGSVVINGQLRDAASIATGVALKTLFPILFDLVKESAKIGQNVYTFGGLIAAQDFKTAASVFLDTMQTTAKLGTIVYGGPELLIILLLTQAAKEIGQSYNEFMNGNYPECAANLLYAAIRIDAAKPHYQDIHRNWFGSELKQTDLDQLFDEIIKLQQAPGQKLIDFDSILAKYNFKKTITGLSFTTQQMKNIAFKNLTFKDSSFKDASIKSSTFENVTFKNCDLSNARIIHSLFSKNHFINTDLSKAELNWSSFKNVTFTNSNLSAAVLNNTQLRNVYFTFCNLFESTFFDADVKDSGIISSNLKDCLLFDAKEQFYIVGGVANEITRPVIGLLYDFEEPKIFAKKIDESLKGSSAIVFRFHYGTKINTEALDLEVKALLTSYKSQRQTDSIPQYIIKNAVSGSEIDKIKNYAGRITPHIDSLILPGGLDIQPELYGKVKEPLTNTDADYMRSIFEFSLIDQVNAKNIPTLAVCRGAQMVNVFFGGTLNQHVANHHRVFHNLKIQTEKLYTETGRIAYNILKGQYITGLSMHHQAIQRVAKNLDVLLDFEGIPKMLISQVKRGMAYSTFALTQFHPEMISFDAYKHGDFFANNNNFFLDLIRRAKIYCSTKAAPM